MSSSSYRKVRRRFESRFVRLVTLFTFVAVLVSFAPIGAQAGASSLLSNTITPATAPTRGYVGNSFIPSAIATSHDLVVVSLDVQSTGCVLKAERVTFTSVGTCLIDYNDAGNTQYASAPQVQQRVNIAASQLRVQPWLYVTSIYGTFGYVLVLSTRGGSGTGFVTYALTSSGSAGCSLEGSMVRATTAGTCQIMATRSGDAIYAPTSSQATTIYFAKVVIDRPVATRVVGAAITGGSVILSIVGSGFYGSPLIFSSAVDTQVRVLQDKGRLISISVTTGVVVPIGVHWLTLTFMHGQRTSVRYRVG
ncbi:MAG: hypothetical protein ACYCPT_08185 [Acidimicrobiales bacterium]